MSDNKEFNLDQLLDGTLDDIADMPEFKPFPAGHHVVIANLIDKATDKKNWVNGHPAYELKMSAVETKELVNADDIPLVKGAETSVLYMLDNELGQGQFKKVVSALAAKFGAKSNRELIAEMKNLECEVITKTRANKDKTQTYTDVVELVVS